MLPLTNSLGEVMRTVEEKLKRQQAESGSGELICPPSLSSQHEK